MVKVSIIIPIYNTSKYLSRCIDSVINQTLSEIEIILINDGSTDESHKIIDEYNDPRIKYYKRKNFGIGNSRNFGISNSNGEYVCFVDSDDYLNNTFCEEMYNKCISDALDMCVCDYYHYIENEQTIEKYILPSFESTSLENNPKLLIDINLSSCNKMYKRTLFINNELYFPEDLKYEDAIFVISAISDAKNIGFIEDKLNYYLIRNKSETTVVNEKVFDILKILDLIYNKLNKKKYFEHIKNNLEYLFITVIFRYTLQQKYMLIP